MKRFFYLSGLVFASAFPSLALAKPVAPHGSAHNMQCAPSSASWFASAYDYVQKSQHTAGTRAAIYVTISMASLEPADAVAGKAPDRTRVWYAKGEVKLNSFPNSPYWAEGTLPLWTNFGTAQSPFDGGKNQTLKVVLQSDGNATFHHQIDGRNRLGKGPQKLKFPAALPTSSDDTLVWSMVGEFNGTKRIVVTFTKGEAVIPTLPKQPIGARYRISPSFNVTNSEDGPGDNTVELRGHFSFRHSQRNKTPQNIPDFAPSGSVTAGPLGLSTLMGTPFEVEAYFEPGASLTKYFYVTGTIEDHDKASANDPLWDHIESIRVVMADVVAKGGTITIKGDGNSESGDLQFTITKIADLY